MFLAAAHCYLFLCLLLSTECLVSASEQVVNPDEWRGINALLLLVLSLSWLSSASFPGYYSLHYCLL